MEAQIRQTLRKVNTDKLGGRQKAVLANLRQVLGDARLYANAYELSEVRDEQQKNARQARHWLERARRDILEASETDIFSAIDVAHLSAQVDLIIEQMS